MSETRANPLIDTLNPMQKEAVLHGDGPLLILAGAGSGKTRVITHRIAHLIRDRGVWPSEILAITFTNKAAREMQERIENLLGEAGRGMWIGTFHAMFLRILRRHANLLGFSPNFSVIDPSDEEAMLKEEMKRLDIPEKHFPPKRVLNIIGYAKSRMLTPAQLAAEAQDYDPLKKHAAELYEVLQERMKRENIMDFDDILNYSVVLLRDFPAVREAYQSRFKHILVDEYQDTNRAQYLLVHLLAGENGNLCVVGDDDQSIYAFRGADLNNILDFEKDYPDAKVIKLEQNYRSTDKILSAANAVIAQNSARKPKKLWTDNPEGERLVVYRAEDHYDEARYVAREARRLIDMGYKASEIAVLYRINALSRNIEFALREQGIPYHVYGGTGFYERAEIMAALAYVRFILDSRDPQALRRILQNPRRGVGDVSFERMVRAADATDGDLLRQMKNEDDLPELNRPQKNLAPLVEQIEDLRQQLTGDLPFHKWLEAVIMNTGLYRHYQKEAGEGSEEAVSRLENLRELISDALEYEAQRRNEWTELLAYEETLREMDPSSLSLEELSATRSGDLDLMELARGFVEKAALYTALDVEAEEAMTLLTTHSAKGLEFDIVFIVGMEETVFPSYRALDSLEELEEERRLAYVAITRARQRLYLSTTRSRLLYGHTRYNIPSRFLDELPDDCVVVLGGNAGGFSDSGSAALDQGVSGRPSLFDRGRTRKNELFGFGQKHKEKAKKPDRKGGIDWQSLEKGSQYRHPQHGIGVIKDVLEVGDDAIITMDFPDKTRRFMANRVLLEAVDES